MGKGNDSYDPVVHRTLYFERIRRDDKEFMLFMPAYTVTYPGLGGSVFEPVDCLLRVQGPQDGSNSSQSKIKDINEVREWVGHISRCQENNPVILTLHSFHGWPR